jgi:hypothetical protein
MCDNIMINKRKGECFMKITNRTGENITLDMLHGRYYAFPYALERYYLNGKCFDEDDFGEKEDEGGDCDDEDIMLYGCVNRVFKPYDDEEYKNEAMVKYGITENEYYEIQDKLESELYVGECGWCV